MPSYLSSRAVQVGVVCLLIIPAFAIPRNIDCRAQDEKPPPKGRLSVTVRIPTTVTDVRKFDIELTLANTGDKPFSVVKDPDGPLFDKLPTYAWDFHLEGKTAGKIRKQPIVDGADRPMFIGAFINWSLDTYLSKLKPALRKEDIPVAEKKSGKMEGTTETRQGGDGSTSPDKLIALKKGETKKIIYKVGNAYDFIKSGAGTYSVKSVRDSFWITPDGGKTIEEVEVAPVKHTVKISGKLSAPKASAKSSDTTVVEKRALRTTECSEDQVAIIRRSADHAIDYARESLTYMSASTGDRPRYTYWFGPWDHTRAAPNNALLVRTSVTYAYHVMNLRSFMHGYYTYDCSCDLQTTAYVAPRLFQNPVINLCPGFWQEDFPFTGHLSRAGVLIHEASHFLDVAGTKDHSYEYTDSHEFAVTNPEIAVNNANNFKFFSENVEGRA